jgi:hypothetical protein
MHRCGFSKGSILLINAELKKGWLGSQQEKVSQVAPHPEDPRAKSMFTYSFLHSETLILVYNHLAPSPMSKVTVGVITGPHIRKADLATGTAHGL